jgi:hypothetical protein
LNETARVHDAAWRRGGRVTGCGARSSLASAYDGSVCCRSIEYRFAAAAAGRYQPLATELVALQPEVILAVSTPVTAALQRETTAIPIVFLGVSDPIGSGFAAKPGATGRQSYRPDDVRHRQRRKVAGNA